MENTIFLLSSDIHSAICSSEGMLDSVAVKPGSVMKDKLLPIIGTAGQGYSPLYEWERPLPLPPFMVGGKTRKGGHINYCDYYRLLKKGMQQHVSVSSQKDTILLQAFL